ncbi:hypothetical protein LZ31DRAFT_333402 [Colletotrichum somersetense]|nr:hypothetical protein LZ31DRAFT_333402 [Colletotrichum somersetense]
MACSALPIRVRPNGFSVDGVRRRMCASGRPGTETVKWFRIFWHIHVAVAAVGNGRQPNPSLQQGHPFHKSPMQPISAAVNRQYLCKLGCCRQKRGQRCIVLRCHGEKPSAGYPRSWNDFHALVQHPSDRSGGRGVDKETKRSEGIPSFPTL